jgi:hypothetical protein
MKKIIRLTLVAILSTASPAMAQQFEVPSDALVEAAMTLSPPKGPAYEIEGLLDCTSISSEFPPYVSERNCSVTLNEGTISLDAVSGIEKKNIDALVNALMEIKPPTSPAYSIIVWFSLKSINSGWGSSSTSATVSF